MTPHLRELRVQRLRLLGRLLPLPFDLFLLGGVVVRGEAGSSGGLSTAARLEGLACTARTGSQTVSCGSTAQW